MKKFKYIRVVLGLMVLGLFCGSLNAQISEGGIPPSFAYPSMVKSFKAPVMVRADFDVKQQIALDKKEREDPWIAAPLKIGKMLPVDLSIENSGEWTTLPDGTKIWRVTINSPGALSIMLYYDEFYIPKGGKLFIYNKSKSQVLGAYTNETNSGNRQFATEFVIGDEITLEYVSNQKAEDNVLHTKADIPKIKISHVVYGYNNLMILNSGDVPKTGFYDDAENSCMVNVNCEEGANWQDQKKGVAATVAPILSQPGSVGLCSGTIINNTAQDLTPYFLTAFHCFEDGFDNNMATMIFYFHYETPGCAMLPIAPTGSKTMVGADILTKSPIDGGSDGQLLKLNNNIPLDYEVYYNGWDRSNTPATSGVGIHHPGGDVKKISSYTAPAESTYWNGVATGAPNAHWNIIFAATANGHSVTEGGSSGSPMFNQNKLVVGTLSGGTSKCTALNGRNLYGKLWYHWDQYSDATQHMAQYLDPIGTGQETLNGTYIPQLLGAAFGASSTNIYVLQNITYKDFSSKATTWNWTFQGGTPASSTEKDPPAVRYDTLGVFETKLVINKGTADEAEVSKTITVTERGVNPVSPIANFSLTKGILLQEDFSGTFPPTGWEVDNRGASTENWIKGNLPEPTPDPISPKQAAYHKWDDNNVAEGWLITKDITIPSTGATVEFYCIGGGQYQQKAWTRFYVIDENDTEVELWNNGAYETETDYVWANPTVDLSAYAGQTVRLAWRYYGKAGDASMIDGVIVYEVPDPDEKLTINVGDYINPVDLSTGPPILYEWSFPGGEPETSDKEEPTKVRYMTPGTYDVTLKVKNYRGEHTRTLTGAVTVVDVAPEANYEASVSYTRRENFGLFVPAGTEVDFSDKSLNYPSSWEWTFEGGEPASSTQQNPNAVSFNTEGEFDFKFKAINSGGNGEIAIAKGTKVGYTRDTIWNLVYGEKDSRARYSYTYGYVTGTNTYDITSYAERFDAPLAEAAITAVKVNLTANGANNSHQLLLSIAKVGSDGLPGAIIGSATLPLSAVNQTTIADDKPTLVEFDVPVAINEPYFVLVGDPTGNGGDFDAPGYTAAIVTSTNRSTEGKNTSYRFDSYFARWESLSKIFTNFSASMDIAPVLTYAQHEGIDAKKFVFKNIDPTVATVNMKTNLPWKATSDASWINITNGSGDGDGSFTFTVDDNKYSPRKSLIKVSAGEAYTDYILLMQAGPAPEDLTAVITDEDAADIALTWEAPNIMQPYKLGDNIFENAEEHLDFLNASPGYYGWKYLDLDAQITVGINGVSFPGSKQASSFRVFTPSRTTPAGNASFNSHDGSKKYFAAFGAGNSTVTNDWMISPKLGFTEQFKVSFWARSYSGSYPERLRVLYSTTGDAPVDFTNELTTTPYQVLPAAWIRYEYTLPANATYVAFNCVSDAAFIMFIDNIFIGIGDAPLSEQELAPSTDVLEIKAAVEAGKKSGKSKKTRKNELAGVDIRALTTDKLLVFKDEVTGETFEVIQKGRVNNEEQLTPKFEAVNKEDKQQAITEELDALNDIQSLPTTKLRYDKGTNVNTIGFDTTADVPMEVAIRFTPTDLLAYQGAKMKAVDVYLKGVPTDGIVLKVRQGDMVYRQQVSSAGVEKFTRISLNKELYIEATEDLYIGYEFVQRGKQYVAGVGAGPAVIGKGDLIGSYGYSLESLYEMTGGQLSYNWNIALVVEDNKDAVDIKYNVYRNNELIKTVDETMLKDDLSYYNHACYEVSAVYFGEVESTLSNASCVILKSLLSVSVTDATRYVGEPNPSFELTVFGDLLPGHTYNDIISLCNVECLADEQSAPGTYPITVKPFAHSDYRLIYHAGSLTVRATPTLSGTPVLSGTLIGNVNMQLDWTAVTGAASYVIYRAGVEVATVTELTYSDNTLTPGTYCYTVKGVSSTDVESEMSNEVCTTVKHPLTVGVENIARYVGEPNPSFKPTIIGALLPGHTYDHIFSLCSIECLADGQSAPGTYPITVKPITHNDYYFTYQVGTLTVQPLATLSGAPVLTSAVAGDVNVQLDWTAVTGAARYVIYRAGVEIVSVTGLTYSDNIPALGTHCYKVKAVSSTGIESEMSNEACVTLKYPLTVGVENVTRYVGEPNPGFKPTVSGTLLPGHTYDDIVSLCGIECLADELSVPGTYHIVVKPLIHSDYRFIYQTGTLTVLPSTTPIGAPVLIGTIINDVNMQLNWTTVPGAERYIIYREGVEVASVSGLGYSDNTLTPGTYCYKVKGVGSTGVESEISNEVCATVKYLLTVGVEDANRYFGEANPSFKLTYIGFVAGDTEEMLSTKPFATSDATLLSVVGTYPIIVSGGESSKYRFVYNNGSLIIKSRTDQTNPNAFTPYEKDGINDIFLPGAKIEVVNRYGQHIFNGNNGWDGTRKNGQLVSPGTYYYKATLSYGKTLRGSVEVIKKK